MPNGVMTGTGVKLDPYIVMDGYDFNALRNVSTSSSDYKYIEFGADIDLSVYSNFVPIPEKYFNIDGKGYTITDISITTSDWQPGLFARLHTNEYIKNFIIEGELTCNSTSSITGGSLCGTLILYTDAVVSNINSFFSVNYNAGNKGVTVGGLIGSVQVSGRSNNVIGECTFKGSLSAVSTDSGTVYSMIIGGLFGQLYSSNPNAADLIKIEKCITQVNYKVDNRLNMRMGGIFADMSQGYNTSTACFGVIVSKCLTKITMRFTHTSAVTTNTHRVCGITCYPGYSNSQMTVVEKCMSFIDMLWTHQYPINAFRMAGLLYAGTSSSQSFNINQGYAVMRMINPDNLPWTGISNILGSITYLPSSTPTVNVTDAFFDSEIFAEFYDGIFTQTHGLATAQLKSKDFLSLCGWDIDDVI